MRTTKKVALFLTLLIAIFSVASATADIKRTIYVTKNDCETGIDLYIPLPASTPAYDSVEVAYYVSKSLKIVPADYLGFKSAFYDANKQLWYKHYYRLRAGNLHHYGQVLTFILNGTNADGIFYLLPSNRRYWEPAAMRFGCADGHSYT